MDPVEEQFRPRFRIGELARRVGVSAGALRAWERRYSLLEPRRTAGGYRLYSLDDERRVAEMLRLRGAGLATAEAARLARGIPHTGGQAGPDARVAGRAVSLEAGAGRQAPAPARSPAAGRVATLAAALESFDEPLANELIDRTLAELSLAATLEDLILPTLRLLGERWAEGRASVGQEHFASNLLRGRMHGWARGWGGGRGPVALLACPAGERHDLGLLAFGLLLRERGWRIAFLGADSPAATIAESAELLRPDAVVVAALSGRRLRALASELAALADEHPLFVAGAGASARLAGRTGARLLEGGPVAAAQALDDLFAARAAA